MIGNLFNRRKMDSQSNVGNQPVQNSAFAQSSQNIAGEQSQTPSSVFSPQSSVVGSAMKPNVREDLSVLTHLDPRATSVLTQAQQEAKRIKQPLIEPDQILLGLFFDGEIFQLIKQFNLDPGKITAEVTSKEKLGTFVGEPTLSPVSKKIFEEAYKLTKERGAEFVSPEDILLSLFGAAITTAAYLETAGLKKELLAEKLSKSFTYSEGKKSVVDKFGIDLTEQAKAGELDPVVGRDREIERLIHILLRRTKNNPIIIGEAGVGKTAIVEGFAQKIVNKEAPKDLLSKRIIQIDVSSLVAGASHRGEFEERLRNVIKEVQLSSGQIILFIDEIHTLIGTGEMDSALDASNIIKPFLARGKLQLIGTTTTTEYRKYFEKDKAFERRFQPIMVEEPDEENAVKMLAVLKPKYEKFHNVVVPDDALKSAVHLAKRYIGERLLPDKGVDLLDEAAAEVRLENSQGKRQDNIVKEADIQKVVSGWTGIPITKLTENESEKLLHLEEFIHKKLIDQENAVKAVCESVRRGRIGLSSANRPIASFIFLGPTGVGKTELAKTLAEILFGKVESMIRLDMSEYMEKHEVAKLIGAPPGYVGYEEGGQLTEAVRAKPYSIVLLDEIEKAHPDVFNILLQLLEDGRLTDNKGNTISFKNTIIIATSNIGSASIQQELSENANEKLEDLKKKFKELSKMLTDELRKFFKPELLNRFDEVVIFEPLGRKDMASIAKLGIEATRKLLIEQNIDLEISQNALDVLAKEGYDPVYGARPLRRLIQSAIENPIAILIIGKTFAGGDKILIDYDTTKDEFTFTKAVPQVQNQPEHPGAGQNFNEQVPGTNPQNEQPVQNQNMQTPVEEVPPQQPNQQSAEQNPVGQFAEQNLSGQIPGDQIPKAPSENQNAEPIIQQPPVEPPPPPPTTTPTSLSSDGLRQMVA